MATNDYYTRQAKANADLERQYLYCLKHDIKLTLDDEEYQIHDLTQKHQTSAANLRKTLKLLKKRYPNKSAIPLTQEVTQE